MPLKSAVGEMEIKKREFGFLFFGRQCTGSAGGFDKHRIKKPWPKVKIHALNYTKIYNFIYQYIFQPGENPGFQKGDQDFRKGGGGICTARRADTNFRHISYKRL